MNRLIPRICLVLALPLYTDSLLHADSQEITYNEPIDKIRKNVCQSSIMIGKASVSLVTVGLVGCSCCAMAAA